MEDLAKSMTLDKEVGIIPWDLRMLWFAYFNICFDSLVTVERVYAEKIPVGFEETGIRYGGQTGGKLLLNKIWSKYFVRQIYLLFMFKLQKA